MRISSVRAIAKALEEAEVRYIVVGGVAVNAHGYQRLTQDLDLVLSLAPENARRALAALADLGYRPMIPVEMTDFANVERRSEWIAERNLQVFSLVSEEHPDTTVDIFASEPFDFGEEHRRALEGEIAPGVRMRFLRLEALIAMKKATGRPRDADDAVHLRWILEEKGRE